MGPIMEPRGTQHIVFISMKMYHERDKMRLINIDDHKE